MKKMFLIIILPFCTLFTIGKNSVDIAQQDISMDSAIKYINKYSNSKQYIEENAIDNYLKERAKKMFLKEKLLASM